MSGQIMKHLVIGSDTYDIEEYTLPIASSSTLGGIKVGSGLSIDSSTGVLTATGTSVTVDTEMSDSSTNPVQNKVIKAYSDGLIAALDGGTIGTPGTGKTVSSVSQTDGNISIGFSDISITKSQVSDFSHAHGNITSGGDITATAPTIANGDQLVINDNSASKITNGPTFDGSTTTKALSQKGTWETFLTEHQSLSGYVPTSRTINSKALTSDITLSASDVGASASDHTHTLSIASDSGTSSLSMSANTKYKLTAGGETYIFTTPSDTTYESKSAASGGTAVSLVTTGEKYTWNNKSDLTIGTTAGTAAEGNHTHTLTIASDSGTSALDMTANTKYKITAGGSTYIFKTPAGGSTYTAGTGLTLNGTAFDHSNSVTAQTTSKLVPIKFDAQGHITEVGSEVTRLPASDVSAWAKAADKPSYTYSEVGAAASSHDHGNITSGGDITATAPTIASGDQIVINDSSASKITNGPTFDGSTTTKALTQKGTWETFLQSFTETDPTVPSWAKASSKPTYTYSEVGAASSGHTHTTTLAADTGTSTITLESAGKYKLTAGDTSVIFTMPTIPTVDYPVTSVAGKTGAVTLTSSDVGLGNVGNFKAVSTVASQGLTDTEKSNARTNIGAGTSNLTLGSTSTTAAAGDHTHSNYVPTTRTVNSKALSSDITLDYSDVGAASSGHTHTLSMATSSGTSSIDLEANTKYQLTAGGSTYIFKTPAGGSSTDSYHTSGSWSGLTYTATAVGNAGTLAFTIPTGTTSTTVSAGNHSHTFASITSKPTTLSGYGITDGTAADHTHPYDNNYKFVLNTSDALYTSINNMGWTSDVII